MKTLGFSAAGLAVALALILAGRGSTPTNRGDSERNWTTVLRDQPVLLRGVPMTTEAERRIGASLVQVKPVPLLKDAQYIQSVADVLLAHRKRPDSPVTLHVDGETRLRWPVALPGGHVVVPVGILTRARNEAELAHLLASAIVESQERIPAERYLAETLRRPKAKSAEIREALEIGSLNNWEEQVIDRDATRWAMAAGYWPRAGIEVLERTYSEQSDSGKLQGRYVYPFQRTPVSHAVVNREQKDSRYYRGRQNFLDRTAKSQKEWPGEWFTRKSPPPYEAEASGGSATKSD
jgi:hypothetical protein